MGSGKNGLRRLEAYTAMDSMPLVQLHVLLISPGNIVLGTK